MAGRWMTAIGEDVPPARAALATELRGMLGGVRLADLARRMGKSSSTASRFLSGRRMPEWDDVEAITRVCGGDPARAKELWQAANDERLGERSPHLACRVDELERKVEELTGRIEQLER